MAWESKTEKAEQRAFSNAVVAIMFGILGTGLGASLVYLATPIFETLPSWLRYILVASGTIGILNFLWLLVRLGGAAAGSEHRAWYLDFKAGIFSGHEQGFYARGVTRAIAWTDRLLGDADKDDRGIFSNVFGLKEAAPLWTASSYDRSLLVAIFYPFFVIVLLWAATGNVGEAETALMLGETAALSRIISLFASALVAYITYLIFRLASVVKKVFLVFINILLIIILGGTKTMPLPSIMIAILFFVSLVPIFIYIFSKGKLKFIVLEIFNYTYRSGMMLINIVFGIFFSGAITGELLEPLSVVLTFGYILGSLFIIIAILTFSLIFSSYLYFIYYILKWSDKKSYLGIFLIVLSIFSFAMSGFVIPFFKFDGRGLDDVATIMYFFSFITILKAPFDWLAIGLTRGLIRRGQELGGVWPILFAFFDVFLSLIIMSLVALIILWGTEIYNFSNGFFFIPTERYLYLLNDPTHRSDPEYYWLYTVLFSSQVPALVNLAFGAVCLLRGLPYVNNWMAARLPESGGIGSWARLSVATAHSLQLTLAIALGCIVYYGLVAFLIGLIDPIFGIGLLEILKALQITPLLG